MDQETKIKYAGLTRYDLIEFIRETTNHSDSEVLNDLIGWLSDDDYREFHEYYCRLYSFEPTQEELDKKMAVNN